MPEERKPVVQVESGADARHVVTHAHERGGHLGPHPNEDGARSHELCHPAGLREDPRNVGVDHVETADVDDEPGRAPALDLR